WDDATLDAYLLKPRDVVKKGKMVFAGFKKEKDRNDVIAYLKTLKD
ncbi:MAG: MFS transporter, partial [Kordiimonadaceae bacterium]|nr:MFS transporter [Kordiimonadaceae bacterium]